MLALQVDEHSEVGPHKWPLNYKWTLCTGTVPLCIEYPGGDSEVSDNPYLRTQKKTTGSVDRKGHSTMLIGSQIIRTGNCPD